jgi:hypothetical protein
LGCFRSLDRIPRATKKFADVGGGASATDHGSRRGGRRRAGTARKSRLTAIAYMWNIAVMDRWVQTADVRSGCRLRWSEIQMQRTVRRQHPVLAKRLGRFHAPSTAMSGQRGTYRGRTNGRRERSLLAVAAHLHRCPVLVCGEDVGRLHYRGDGAPPTGHRKRTAGVAGHVCVCLRQMGLCLCFMGWRSREETEEGSGVR